MTLTPDEVLAQLRTRGFEDDFEQTPLKEFRGKLDSITGSMIERFTPPRLEVLYNFSDVEVIEIRQGEVWTSPVAQIAILHSSKKKSGMGYFGASIDRVINAGLPEGVAADQVKGQDYLQGKTLHMKRTPGHMIWDGKAQEERPRDCWELMAVIGEGAPAPTLAPAPGAPAAPPAPTPGVSPTDVAKAALEGLTEQQWLQKIFQDPAVKADTGLVDAIIGRTFLPGLEAAGLVTKDANGVYHVVG